MYTRNQFGTTAAQEKLATLQDSVAYPKSGKSAEVNDLLEKVIFSLQIHGAAPRYVITRALYTEEDNTTLQSARFVVSPAVSHKLAIADLKKTFTINAGEDFFNRFIREMAEYFDTYTYHAQLQENIEALNGVFREVIEENEIQYTVEFSLGEGLLDASDDSAVIGLNADVIEGLASLALFDDAMESRAEGYKARILETLKEASKPYEIVKVKSPVTKDLGIYSRRSLSKLMRQFVNRNAEFVRTGTGYVETTEIFAIVNKVAVTEEEAAEFEGEDVLVVDNEGASAKEKAAGKTKILVTYKVSPFNKENGVPTDVSLSEVV